MTARRSHGRDTGRQLYVIERRHADGTLDLRGLQPESVFGMAAVRGITDNEIAQGVWSRMPNAVMRGSEVESWPAIVDPAWRAREKTW